MAKLSKKLIIILAFVGSGAHASCFGLQGNAYWNCFNRETHQENTLNTQRQLLWEQQETNRLLQQQQPRQCFRDYWGNVQCY